MFPSLLTALLVVPAHANNIRAIVDYDTPDPELCAEGDLDLEAMTEGEPLVIEHLPVRGYVDSSLPLNQFFDVSHPPLAQTREHILLSRQVDVPAVAGHLDLRVDAIQFREVPVVGTRETELVMDVELVLEAIVPHAEADDDKLSGKNAVELTEFTIKAENSTNVGSSTGGGGGAGKVKYDRLTCKKYSDHASFEPEMLTLTVAD